MKCQTGSEGGGGGGEENIAKCYLLNIFRYAQYLKFFFIFLFFFFVERALQFLEFDI